MPRANRYYLPNHIWHITHRCHKQEFLLKFSRDRKRWLHWLFEAKKRYGICVLNYIVTSNHIHLLVVDTKPNCISKSMQLIAGRTAQEYNQRKKRKGAFWEDRYFATAIDSDTHLTKCLTYIDLNMVRAGVVKHPLDWKESGYNEIQQPAHRYRIIDRNKLLTLLDLKTDESLKQYHKKWIDEALLKNNCERDAIWSQSLAVGSKEFTEKFQKELASKASGRGCIQLGDMYYIKESSIAYINTFNG